MVRPGWPGGGEGAHVRVARLARPGGGEGAHARRLLYVLRMWWPLIGALIAFVLVAVLMGWLMDTSRRDGGMDTDHH